jgi:hypothetical protein
LYLSISLADVDMTWKESQRNVYQNGRENTTGNSSSVTEVGVPVPV